TGLIVLGLAILAISWIVRQWGRAAEEYTGGIIQTKQNAESVTCQMNMRTIGQNIQIYFLTNEEFPPSMDELRQFSGSSKLFRCPDREGAEYIYVPGQTNEMSGSNILVYEPNAVHDDHCSVLLLNGAVGLIGPEELDAALRKTQAEILARHR
ncbi:MAG: hypothetical protein ACYS8Z_01655, partial [Planctomycetota bacterium]